MRRDVGLRQEMHGRRLLDGRRAGLASAITPATPRHVRLLPAAAPGPGEGSEMN
jgi:hypothetical protein